MSDVLMFEKVIKVLKDSSKLTELTLTLPYEKRQKSRFRAQINNGKDAGISIERGSVLRGGDYLQSRDGQIVLIISADEEVSSIHCDSAQDLARAAYHLGNRHVSLQVGGHWLRYLKDHVLDEMIQGFGLIVKHEFTTFEPEVGAYHGGHSHASHDDNDKHNHHH